MRSLTWVAWTVNVRGLDTTFKLCCSMAVIPDFLPNGTLPAGIHNAGWSDITARFGINPHRQRLLSGFQRAVGALTRAGCRVLYLDGSFVTTKPLPNDYDACWEITGVRAADVDPVFLDFGNERAAQKAKYFGEFFPAHAPANLSPPLATFLNFFQADKATGDPKGIIRLNLNGST